MKRIRILMRAVIHLVEGSGGRYIIAKKIGALWYSHLWPGHRPIGEVARAPSLMLLMQRGIATYASQNGAHRRYRRLGYPSMDLEDAYRAQPDVPSALKEAAPMLGRLSELDRDLGQKVKVCSRCGQFAIFSADFMLLDHIWLEANGGERKGHMHLGCAQEALGRPLTIADFSRVAVNYPIFFGYTMGRRDDGLSEM